MKNSIKKSLKTSNGITLIALVITVIVLLILAGISISMLSGDNSILQRATDAKTKSDEAQIRERIQLAYHSSLTFGLGKVEESTLKDEIKKEFNKTDSELEENWLDKTSVTGKWRITIDGVYLDVPAEINEIGSSSDKSAKIYNSIKDKTPQEIIDGVIIDGVKTKFISASSDGATIEYIGRNYIVSLNPTDYSVLSVTAVNPVTFGNSITFYVHNLEDERLRSFRS